VQVSANISQNLEVEDPEILKKTRTLFMIGSLAAFVALSQDTAGQDLKKSGEDVKQADKATGYAAQKRWQGCSKRDKEGCS